MAAAIGSNLSDPHIATVLLVGGGGVAGGVAGGVIATPCLIRTTSPTSARPGSAPRLLAALDQIAATTGCRLTSSDDGETTDDGAVGRAAAAGRSAAGLVRRQLPGFALGIGVGAATAKHAPSYGRVVLIQSAAMGGAIDGRARPARLQVAPLRQRLGVHECEVGEASSGGPTLRAIRAHRYPMSPRGGTSARIPVSSILMPPAPSSASTSASPPACSAPTSPIRPDTAPAGGACFWSTWPRFPGALAGGVGACVVLVEDCLRAPQTTEDARAIAAGAALIGDAGDRRWVRPDPPLRRGSARVALDDGPRADSDVDSAAHRERRDDPGLCRPRRVLNV